MIDGPSSPGATGAVALVVGCAPERAATLVEDLREVSAGLLRPVVVDDADAAIEVARQLHAAGDLIPIAFVEADLDHDRGAASAVAIHLDPTLAATRLVLVTERASLHGMDEALRVGAVHGMITHPWTRQTLQPQVKAQLATHLVAAAGDRLDEFDALLDEEDHRLARLRAELQRSAVPAVPDRIDPLLDPTDDPTVFERRLVELLDRALGHPPRIRVAPGTVLIDEGDDVGGIYVLLEGAVRMSTRTPDGEHIFHEHSAGPILGVLSLASHRRAMLRCEAVTEVRAIPVTLEQLGRALAAEPDLSNVLVRVLLASLAGRLRQADALQVELDQSLAALSAARAQLIATARFTAAGEIAAGMAHELNNPTSALQRGLDHLLDDVAAVVDDRAVLAVARRQLEAPARSSAEQRALRRELTELLGDRRLAERMLEIGVTEPEQLAELADVPEAELARLESAARLGRTVRNLATAATGIGELVGALRAYLRGEDGEGPLLPDVDLSEGIDAALRLMGHRLDAVTVERRYDQAPTVTARPGAMQQVWANLVTNALDAMGDRGRLEIHLRPVDDHHVVVTVTDDGPGIDPGLLPRIFEPRFTTKDGKVAFGMGLGLSICRQIVEGHGGTIGVDSRPGRTTFTVRLPVGGVT